MSNSRSPADQTTPFDESPVPACRLVPTAPRPSGPPVHAGDRRLRAMGRPDTLTAQRVEVGIVLQAMLGTSAATDYFSKHRVSDSVAMRVLSPSGRRRGSHDASGLRI